MQVKKEEVYKRILSVSEKLFIRYGYKKTSLNMIASRCYISKSNVYRYFSSKDDIYEALVGDSRKNIFQVTDRLMKPDFANKSLREKVEEITSKIIDVVTANRHGILVMLKSGREEDIDLIANKFTTSFSENSPYKDERFKELVAKLLIYGLSDVIMEYEDPVELKNRILLLMTYHYMGYSAFINKEAFISYEEIKA